MNAAIVIPAVGWGLFLLLQMRRRRNNAQAPPEQAPEQPAPPPQAPEQPAPPPQAPGEGGLPPAMDEKGFIGGLDWQSYLNRHPDRTVDPETGVVVIPGPGGKPSFTNARDAMRFEANRQSIANDRVTGFRGDSTFWDD